MTPILLALMTFFSTFFGGLFALKNKGHIHHILGFTAGVLIGVVAFDILPEIFDLVEQTHDDPLKPMIALVIGFLLFHIAEKLILIHHTHESEYKEHHHPQVGVLSALALSAHSFTDGVGIGLAFQVSPAVGFTVALAVIAHDFSDGINTVSLMLVNKNTVRRSLYFLLIDAFAPTLGAISTLFFRLSPTDLLIYLGAFAGFLLYIGASDILPEAHSVESSKLTITLTVVGTIFIFIVTRFAF